MRFSRILSIYDAEAYEIDYDIKEKFGNMDLKEENVYILKDDKDIIGYFISTQTDDIRTDPIITISEFYTIWHSGVGYGMMSKALLDYFKENEGKYIRILLPERKEDINSMEVVVNIYTDHNYSFTKENGQLFIEFFSKSRYNPEDWK